MDTFTPAGRLREIAWAAVYRWIRRSFPDVRHTSVAELAARTRTETDPPPIIIDTRREDEYNVSHIPGAVRLDPAMSDGELAGRWPPDRLIVTYCSIGYRSSAAARRLSALGYSDVRNLEGSIFRWAVEGHPIVFEEGPAHEVHPYDRLWGLLLPRALRARLDR